ncbi:unnamed protein product [Choristocarpus tenellus]
MFATWCPPSERVNVGRLVSREDKVSSSYDGGCFRLDWWEPSDVQLPPNAPVILVLPGVVGKSTNVYIRHLASHFARSWGWRVVAKCWRGIGAPLTTRRPETWDKTALSDTLDAIRHVRKSLPDGVPMMGAGFSYGGFLLSTLVGSVPFEEHGLRAVVSMSGLFQMSAMMRHIAEQCKSTYSLANTKVTLHNYRKFKVVDTLSCTAADNICSGARVGAACATSGRDNG